MNVTVTDRKPDVSAQTQLGFVDCDVHPYTKSPADLDQFLSEKWRKHRQTIGNRARARAVQCSQLTHHLRSGSSPCRAAAYLS